VRLEHGSARRRLELLEAVDEPERLRVEHGELLLDRDGEVTGLLVLLPGKPEHLLPGELLRFTH
jgi:hypothetical protein